MPVNQELIPHLFRTEYSKITSVLCRVFGMAHIETAEDLVSDTFLLAAETWGLKGLPKNPAAWLYTVAKNKAKDHLRRDQLFAKKISLQLNQDADFYETGIDLSEQNIGDSQLQMMFAICDPSIPVESQIGLSLSILCGFGVDEIADAFLSTRESIYKRLSRAKEKLRAEKVQIVLPSPAGITSRLPAVLSTLYLLFNEGYYSSSQNTTLRKDLCIEAMRLVYMLIENPSTDKPQVNALMSLMCFHASRFEARIAYDGSLVIYDEQNDMLWDKELIRKGEYYLNKASTGHEILKYHLEAAIAYWHTIKTGSSEKWESVLLLYNKLLLIEYSPMAALNRTYALSKAKDKKTAIAEAEKLGLLNNHLYHCLLGDLYTGIKNETALRHLDTALSLARSDADRNVITKKITQIKKQNDQ